MSFGIYFGICILDCRGIIVGHCLAYGITIRPNNIIIKVKFYLGTQIPGSYVRREFVCCGGR